MNIPKLKGKLTEKKKTYIMCSKILGMSVPTFNAKMNGKSKFYIDELEKLGNYLEMTPDEKADIFLH